MRFYEPYAAPVLSKLLKAGVTPNQLTWFSVPPAILAGVCVAFEWFLCAAVFFLVSGLCDLLDGALARHTEQESPFGALLDSSLDRVADACIPISLIALLAHQNWTVVLPALALLSSLWISYIRARAQSLGLEIPRLWMRREDRFGAVIIGLLLSWILGSIWPITLVMAAIGALGLIAGFHALRTAERLSHQQKSSQ